MNPRPMPVRMVVGLTSRRSARVSVPSGRRFARLGIITLALGGCANEAPSAVDPVSDPADEAPDAAWANATAPRIYDEFEGQPVMALDPGPDCQILWCLTSIPGDHSPKDADRAVEFATRVWSRRTGVHFTSTPGCVDAALMIGESRQDGPDGRLGMLWFEGSAVHIEVDSDEWWSVQGDPGDVVVEFVIAHLLGHALGVGHSDRADDLMSPIYHSDRSLADQPWRDTPVQFDLGLAACHSGGR